MEAFKNMWFRQNESAAGHNSYYSLRGSMHSGIVGFVIVAEGVKGVFVTAGKEL